MCIIQDYYFVTNLKVFNATVYVTVLSHSYDRK